jgi:predicted enzyme related to lactoylglutathione lyase
MGEYVVVTTTPSDSKTGRPATPGAINGGLYKMSKDPFSQHPSVVISVEDLDKSIKLVKDGGGTIHDEPYEIPGVGRYVSVVDTEGNRISLLQPISNDAI